MARGWRRRRGVRRARIRRIASVPSRRCSTVPQRSIFRNTGPNRVPEASSQSRSACTGQVASVAPEGMARRRVPFLEPTPGSGSSTAVALKPHARRRGRPARRGGKNRRRRAAAGRGPRTPEISPGQAAGGGGGSRRDGPRTGCLSPRDRRRGERNLAWRWRPAIPPRGGPARRRFFPAPSRSGRPPPFRGWRAAGQPSCGARWCRPGAGGRSRGRFWRLGQLRQPLQ
jgi:hypothetical protein